MKITIEIKADKTLIKAINDLREVLEKANTISIPKTWVNDRPVIITGGTWPQTQKEGGTSTSGSATWHPNEVTWVNYNK
jgi:hypothetical protein